MNKLSVIDQAKQDATTITTTSSKEADQFLVKARSLNISTGQDYEGAVDFLKIVKSGYNGLEKKRREIVNPINAAKAVIQDMFKPDLVRYKEVEGIIKGQISIFLKAEEVKRKKAQEEAERKARVEEEKRKKELEKQAANAESKGKLEKAEEKREEIEQVHVPVNVPQPAAFKKKGISTSIVWKARVVDKSKIPHEYLDVNLPMLNKVGQATKGQLRIDGVEFYSENVISSRR